MGAPSCGLIAEIFLQYLEHSHLTHVAHKRHIINYCRYVDGIFLIFDSNNTNIQNILRDFNTLHPKLQSAAETEQDHDLNYLDIIIQDSHQLWNCHIQKTHFYRYHHTIHLQTSSALEIQVFGSSIPVQQTKFI
jgi:hypothetical protein